MCATTFFNILVTIHVLFLTFSIACCSKTKSTKDKLIEIEQENNNASAQMPSVKKVEKSVRVSIQGALDSSGSDRHKANTPASFNPTDKTKLSAKNDAMKNENNQQSPVGSAPEVPNEPIESVALIDAPAQKPLANKKKPVDNLKTADAADPPVNKKKSKAKLKKSGKHSGKKQRGTVTQDTQASHRTTARTIDRTQDQTAVTADATQNDEPIV